MTFFRSGGHRAEWAVMPPQSIGRRTLRELKISRYMIGGVDMQLALMVLLVGLALGQTPAGESVRGTLVFSHTGTELEVQTIAKIVQQTAAIRDLSVDSATGPRSDAHT